MTHTNPILKNAGFHHVALASSDFDRSMRFYCDLLGCRPKMLWGAEDCRAVMLDLGDGNYIELFEKPETADAPPQARLLHLCLRCDNLDQVVERVRASLDEYGITITVEPKDVPVANRAEGGKPVITVRLAFFTGPDGEIIELMQCPDL